MKSKPQGSYLAVCAISNETKNDKIIAQYTLKDLCGDSFISIKCQKQIWLQYSNLNGGNKTS